ncbi:MAG: bifunctional methylenetetrahydrofolate dehydrogenase/methenyltetrahydrofolate cyclohydrolase FolD [Lachnospiraceae bacterium]|nr:bifunctional methylenetetrahydrofolate dehydrogenase/methenyltetrahydrofolate cyclohydrolase FolD [Lachnospiraceae bacterium]
MKLLDGGKLAAKIKDEVRQEVTRLKSQGRNVCLAVIRVGDDPASSVYVRNKIKACEYCGIVSDSYVLNAETTTDELTALIRMLNIDPYIHGILVQLPLPGHIDESKVLNAIAPEKDVDGFHESNVGKLVIGDDSGFVPCTAKGIVELLKANDIKIEGKHCVIVGRSNIVGKPVAMELLKENATVTICHSKTRGLRYITREADILICAIGKPKFFNHGYIRAGTVVVDVGIHRDPETGTLCGDVDYDDVISRVEAITPVPGGVGPMTVAMLMKNTVLAAQRQVRSEQSEERQAAKYYN